MQRIDVDEELRRDAEQVIALVSENLRWRKDQLELKLWEVSAATGGMDPGNLSRVINGKAGWDHMTLVRLSRAFGVDYVDWFLPHDRFVRRYRARKVRVVTEVKRTSPHSRSDLQERIPA